MDYNTQRKKLILPEYGRYIQSMVDYAKTIKDRKSRQSCAETIVALMRNMYDKNDNTEDVNIKLWNQFATLAEYDIDIDYPVNIERREFRNERKEYLKYPQKKIHERHYGALIEESIRIIQTMEEDNEKHELTRLVANQMKRDLANWNTNALDDEKVFDDIAEYTQGRVILHASDMALISDADAIGSIPSQKKKKKNK
ncbi:MAG: DUF4290 domain-containing protein [Bacteroidaceae bacterium]|nr:DUF4290 domain-containing protein [Bacteroidaceae bacterium]